ncbi:MAG: hypothetical protein ACLRIO_06420 [Butyricicoccus sp.]
MKLVLDLSELTFMDSPVWRSSHLYRTCARSGRELRCGTPPQPMRV